MYTRRPSASAAGHSPRFSGKKPWQRKSSGTGSRTGSSFAHRPARTSGSSDGQSDRAPGLGHSDHSSRSSYAPRGPRSGYAGAGRSGGGSYSNRPRRSYGASSESRGDRPSYSGGSRGGGGRSYGGSRGGSRGRSFGGSRLDISRFINKPVTTEETVEKFVPEHAFKDFDIDPRLKDSIVKKGYELPTPIQDKVIPHILRGSDVVGIANTGTGKTAAFLIPLIDKALRNPKEQILIMTPTRELAIQIDNELQGFARFLGIFSACCVGGAPIGKQVAMLRHKNNFVIGTPGRLKDLMERRVLNIGAFGTVVLDEADRMLDMGFIADMRLIMSQMSATRHTLFFSATLSREIERLISEFLKQPVMVSVKTRETPLSVEQDIVRLAGKNKMDVLQELLKQPGFEKVLIFGKTKHGVERIAMTLIEKGFKAESIHGDKNHMRRQKALGLFKDNKVNILVATDVAARGLDIPGVSHVINYDLPATQEDYVHRIGRTGRGTQKGKALTFVD